MTNHEIAAAKTLLSKAEHHARRAARLTKERRRDLRLARALRELGAKWALRQTWSAMVKVHTMAVENTEGTAREGELRPGTQRIRDHLDTARAHIGTRDETDEWFDQMCTSENTAALCDDLDEDLDVGSIKEFQARFERKHRRRNPPADEKTAA